MIRLNGERNWQITKEITWDEAREGKSCEEVERLLGSKLDKEG